MFQSILPSDEKAPSERIASVIRKIRKKEDPEKLSFMDALTVVKAVNDIIAEYWIPCVALEVLATVATFAFMKWAAVQPWDVQRVVPLLIWGGIALRATAISVIVTRCVVFLSDAGTFLSTEISKHQDRIQGLDTTLTNIEAVVLDYLQQKGVKVLTPEEELYKVWIGCGTVLAAVAIIFAGFVCVYPISLEIEYLVTPMKLPAVTSLITQYQSFSWNYIKFCYLYGGLLVTSCVVTPYWLVRYVKHRAETL